MTSDVLELPAGKMSRDLDLGLEFGEGVPVRNRGLVQGSVQLRVETTVEEVGTSVRGYKLEADMVEFCSSRSRLALVVPGLQTGASGSRPTHH